MDRYAEVDRDSGKRLTSYDRMGTGTATRLRGAWLLTGSRDPEPLADVYLISIRNVVGCYQSLDCNTIPDSDTGEALAGLHDVGGVPGGLRIDIELR